VLFSSVSGCDGLLVRPKVFDLEQQQLLAIEHSLTVHGFFSVPAAR
jgi:hypothetical protein